MRLFDQAKYQFLDKRRTTYKLSGIVIAVGIAFMIYNVFSIGDWQNYGVDFVGGSIIQVRFDQPTTAAQLRAALGGPDAPPITSFGDENEFVVRAELTDEEVAVVADGVRLQLEAAFGAGVFEIVRQESVGPTIGEELQQKAALAMLFSFALTLIYLAIRFEFRFGVAAVIATIHDILITLGFLAALQMEIVLPTVAAILTIVGYSLNDTIVVFDRVRENLNAKGGRRQDPSELVNRSINETLPRTILTSTTTLAVLLSLFFVGGPVIRDFTVVLILGVVVGTYSSIFVASPALLEIQARFGDSSQGADRKKRRRSASAA